MPRKKPPPLGLTLSVLRLRQGWSQKELSDSTGFSRGLLSEYETGTTELTRERLDALARTLGWLPESVDQTLLGLGLLPPPAPERAASPLDPDEEEQRIIDRAAGWVSREAAEVLRRELSAEIRERKIHARRKAAAALWQRLKAFSASDRRLLVRGASEYQDPFLCVLLCEESAKAAASNARMALDLGELALLIAEHVPGSAAWRSRLQGYAWGFVASARRVANDMPAAEADFARVWKLWEEDDSTDLFVLDEGRLCDLEASLRRDQRRFGEALALHDRALASGRPEEAGVRLVKKAKLQEELGEYEEALATLQLAAPWIEEQCNPRLLFVLQFNRAVNLLHLDRVAETEAFVTEAREAAVSLGNELDLVRVLWLTARLSAATGRRDEAIACFEQARHAFATREMAYDFALVSLELSALLLEDGRIGEVEALAPQMVWIFRAQGIPREALAALRIFSDAAEKRELTAEMIRSLVESFHRTIPT